MALALLAQSTGIDGTSNPAINYPTITAANAGHLILAFIHIDNNTGSVATPSGWTFINSMLSTVGTVGSGTGPRGLFIYYKISKGNESGTQTFTTSGVTGSTGIMWLFGCSQSAGFSIASTTGEDTTAGSTWSAAMAGDPGFIQGDLLAYVLGGPTTASNFVNSWGTEVIAPTGCTATFTGATAEWEYSLGNQGAVRGRVATIDSGRSTAAITHTASAIPATATAVLGPEVIIRIREVVADSPYSFNTMVAPGGFGPNQANIRPWWPIDVGIIAPAENNAPAEDVSTQSIANQPTPGVAANAEIP